MINDELNEADAYWLTISADEFTSTDNSFSIDNLHDGDNYVPLDVYFKKADGSLIKREVCKRERKISNQSLPRIAFQIFENQISKLSENDRLNFPVCRYTLNGKIFRGIFDSISEIRKYRKTVGILEYTSNNNGVYYIHCWNIFSTLIFVQECLKRFGSQGDCFKLLYRKKNDNDDNENENEKDDVDENNSTQLKHLNKYSNILEISKNIIFRGAPGTGKTYLARDIATYIVSDHRYSSYEALLESKEDIHLTEQIGFVQFHPSYDYTDFVEGLRPIKTSDNSLGFELKNGIFKEFVDSARKNYENSRKR